ncbi:TldD/PmbA family protein, partial [Candidatus Poribacteria bacterium]|nr:TldD/PmbA family protein [Candidatus Poribacteria bacterium]
MKFLTDLALDTIKGLGASYGDIRIIKTQYESVAAKNEKVSNIGISEDEGFGIRVIANGAWGFASSSLVIEAEIKRIATAAVNTAKASSILKKTDVKLASEESYVDTWRTPYIKDPFNISL